MPQAFASGPADRELQLPEERVPFPVEERYSVRPSLQRWSDADSGHLRLDRRYPEYLTEKLRLLSADPAGCRVPAPGLDGAVLRRALLAAAEGLARDAEVAPPAGPGVTPPVLADASWLRFPLLGVTVERSTLALHSEPPALRVAGLGAPLLQRVRSHLERLEPVARLADALALAVQEDLVVMRGDGSATDASAAAAGSRPTEDGVAELLHVCFPSSWDPAERAGAGFLALHAPVPDNRALLAAAGRVVRAMVAKGPFVRYVWSLAPDGALDRNPRRVPRVTGSHDPASLWFRVERQTVLPLPALGRALFTIRVYRAPLASLLTDAERRHRLASALASMDDALLAYKGVGADRARWLAYLGTQG